MRIKQWASRILFGLTILSLPLCCLPLMALSPSMLFWGQLTVFNASNEILYITPIGESYGQRHILLQNFSKFPYVPLLKQADIRLNPDEQVQINFEVDSDLTLTEIAVRTGRGDYYQMPINEFTGNFSLGLSEKTRYSIGSVDELSAMSPEVLVVARQAGQFNLSLWKMIIPGFVPGILFLSWYFLNRKKDANNTV